jgi:hypothetical protein
MTRLSGRCPVAALLIIGLHSDTLQAAHPVCGAAHVLVLPVFKHVLPLRKSDAGHSIRHRRRVVECCAKCCAMQGAMYCQEAVAEPEVMACCIALGIAFRRE